MEDMDVDAGSISETDEMQEEQKRINEEWKIWRKNAMFLYDTMLIKQIDHPTLTLQWFPDKQISPSGTTATHRILLGTHTFGVGPDYLQIGHVTVPQLIPDPANYDEEKEEIGGYGGGKLPLIRELTWDIVQRIDHPGEVNKARYMPQNPNLIATMCIDGRILVFDRTKHSLQPSGKVNPQIELVGHTQEGFGLNWNPNQEGQLVTGSGDKTVRLWDIKSDFSAASKIVNPSRTFTHHSAVVNDVEFHNVLPWMIASVSDDLTLQILDTRQASNTTSARQASNAHTDAINSVSLNPGSEYILATGSADQSVGIWDLRNLSVKLHSCEGHKDVVCQVEWHPQEKSVLASSSYDRRVILWDLSRCGMEQTAEEAEDGPPELLFMHGAHTTKMSDFSFNRNDPWLMCSAAEDNNINVWKPTATLVGREINDVPLSSIEN